MNDYAGRRGWKTGSGRLQVAVLATVVILLAASSCGSSGNGGGGHPDYAKALAGAPAPLAAIHDQANELLPGGLEAFDERLAALRGYPVVVNFWASWCGPCRFEFPHFQRAAAGYGKRVAFIGVDSQDSDDHAADFLREEPVPYPSYKDPDEEIGNEFDKLGLPATAFYDRRGELVFLQQKPYVEEGELEADIERYALGRDPEGG